MLGSTAVKLVARRLLESLGAGGCTQGARRAVFQTSCAVGQTRLQGAAVPCTLASRLGQLISKFPAQVQLLGNSTRCFSTSAIASVDARTGSHLLPTACRLWRFPDSPRCELQRAGLPCGTPVRGVRLLPKRLWKRKPGLGLKGGQKLKAHSGAKKRFKVSANGKVLVMPAGKQHLNYGTSGRKRQKLRKWRVLHSTQAKTIRMLMLQNGRLLHPYYKPKAKLELRSQPLSDSELKEALS